jgi:hypothetical protein
MASNLEDHNPQANSYTTTQEIPHLLQNLKVHYHVHKTLTMVPIPSQMNPVHTLTLFFKIHILKLSSHPGLPNSLISSHCLIKTLNAFLTCPICATCPAHLILLDLSHHPNNISWRVQIIKLLNTQFLTSFLSLRSKYSPQHPVLKHPQSVFFPLHDRPSFTSIQNNR